MFFFSFPGLLKLNARLVNTYRGAKVIILDLKNDRMQFPDEESYILKIGEGSPIIRAEARSLEGLSNAIASLRSLYIESTRGRGFPKLVVEDSPRFGFRGIDLDIASNFPGYDWLLEFLDIMSSYKLNKLVLPIFNNEGWRLEMKKRPFAGIDLSLEELHKVNL